MKCTPICKKDGCIAFWNKNLQFWRLWVPRDTILNPLDSNQCLWKPQSNSTTPWIMENTNCTSCNTVTSSILYNTFPFIPLLSISFPTICALHDLSHILIFPLVAVFSLKWENERKSNDKFMIFMCGSFSKNILLCLWEVVFTGYTYRTTAGRQIKLHKSYLKLQYATFDNKPTCRTSLEMNLSRLSITDALSKPYRCTVHFHMSVWHAEFDLLRLVRWEYCICQCWSVMDALTATRHSNISYGALLLKVFESYLL